MGRAIVNKNGGSVKKYQGGGIASKIGDAARSVIKATGTRAIVNAIPSGIKQGIKNVGKAVIKTAQTSKMQKGGSVGKSKK
jgi:hypothetical protein